MKIVLEYDPASGAITDKDGIHIFYGVGLENNEIKEDSINDNKEDKLSSLVQLKALGHSKKDILELKEAGLL